MYSYIDGFDFSLTFTIYNTYPQTYKPTFYLRNLTGETADEQLPQVKNIAQEMAQELHYLTCYGIDKVVIKMASKKVEEVSCPELQPMSAPESYKDYFKHAVLFSFSSIYTYEWDITGRTSKWSAKAEEIAQGLQRKRIHRFEKVSFKLPCYAIHIKSIRELSPKSFFQSFGPIQEKRKIIGWAVYHNPQDEIFMKFVNRFQPEGNLCLGPKRVFSAEQSCRIKGKDWPPRKIVINKPPRRTVLATRPTDNTEYVYIIRMGRTNMYKIGKSNDPQGRLLSLQTASPYKLALLHTFRADNASAAEEALHHFLHQVRQEGEWFRLTTAQKDSLIKVKEYKDKLFWVDRKGYDLQTLWSLG